MRRLLLILLLLLASCGNSGDPKQLIIGHWRDAGGSGDEVKFTSEGISFVYGAGSGPMFAQRYEVSADGTTLTALGSPSPFTVTDTELCMGPLDRCRRFQRVTSEIVLTDAERQAALSPRPLRR